MFCRWKGGRSIKLEGSDHIPVYILLKEIPELPVHNVPASAARYLPEVRGRQQSIGECILCYVSVVVTYNLPLAPFCICADC
jgi:hypothetical protein